jgi:hypothetical protein
VVQVKSVDIPEQGLVIVVRIGKSFAAVAWGSDDGFPELFNGRHDTSA